jgi:hypothetical protein
MPSWLLYIAVALIPALIVGALVYFFAGGSDDGGSGNSAGIIEGLITGGDTEGTATYEGELPPGFPDDFPMYRGAEVNASFLLGSEESVRYLIILTTSDSIDEIYQYYLGALDEEPWQVEVARSSDSFTGMRFSRPDNPDVDGQMGIHRSTLGNKTAVYLTIDDVSSGAQNAVPEKPFVLGASRPLPDTFPSDVPIYKGKTDSTVVVSQFGRGGGQNNYIVSFVTKDSQTDVMSFYRTEFQKRGWTVTDSDQEQNSFALGIDFSDGNRQEISGSVSADSFEDDASYTRVDLLLQVSARRGRGN